MGIYSGNIDIKRFEVIKKELNDLMARKTNIPLEDIPVELKEPFLDFLTGRTMAAKEGKPVAVVSDFHEFYRKLWKM